MLGFIDEELTVLLCKKLEMIYLLNRFGDDFLYISFKQKGINKLWVIFEYLRVTRLISTRKSFLWRECFGNSY